MVCAGQDPKKNMYITTKGGMRERGGGGDRESLIIEVDNIVVCAGQDPKNNLEITARGGRRVVDGRRR